MSITGTLIIQIIVFLILVGFTMKFVWPPIAAALDERARKIAEGLAAADKAKAELSAADKKVEQELAKSRSETAALLADAERRAQSIVEDAKGGASLIYFPEGTLTRASGLRPFRMGAFIAAAQTRSAVVPVSLRGTRSVLRDGSWWPMREAVVVHLHEPLWAEGSSWSDAVRLRDRARERIAQGCGEPMLAG